MKSLVLGPLEQELLTVLWNAHKPLTVRDVLAQLTNPPAYTTAMTVLARMKKKGILKRTSQGKSYAYSPVQNKKEYASQHLGSIYKSLVDTYGELAIAQFVDSVKDNSTTAKLLSDYLSKHES